MEKYGYTADHVLPHGSYLVNLGSPNSDIRKKSIQSVVEEMNKIRQLGLNSYNFHPGSSTGKISDQECFENIASGLTEALSRTQDVIAVIENSAGQGHQL